MSQLPAISESAKELPITENDFINLCSRFLDKKTFNAIKSISLMPPLTKKTTGFDFLDKWYDYERKLRIALGQIRALKMKKDFPIYDNISISIVQMARTATGFDSPLEAEIYLNKVRMNILNDISPLDNFSTEALFAYTLKLKLICRMNLFTEKAGLESYRKIYDQILGETI